MLTWARQLSGSPRPSHGPGVSIQYTLLSSCLHSSRSDLCYIGKARPKEVELRPWAPRSHLPHFLVLAITQAFLTEPRIFAVVAESHVGMSQVLLRLKQWPRAEVMAPWTCQKVPLNAPPLFVQRTCGLGSCFSSGVCVLFFVVVCSLSGTPEPLQQARSGLVSIWDREAWCREARSAQQHQHQHQRHRQEPRVQKGVQWARFFLVIKTRSALGEWLAGFVSFSGPRYAT